MALTEPKTKDNEQEWTRGRELLNEEQKKYLEDKVVEARENQLRDMLNNDSHMSEYMKQIIERQKRGVDNG